MLAGFIELTKMTVNFWRTLKKVSNVHQKKFAAKDVWLERQNGGETTANLSSV